MADNRKNDREIDHKVYLVGAGPGDPGLITVKGLALLKRADAVVYDFLANKQLLVHARESAEKVCAGKSAGRHTMPQDEINRLLVKLWREGKTVVRLKGGDPFVFGRGGEEALALSESGVPFEVVPGITAGLAGLAYAGIPPTHRGLAVSTTLVTGHEDPAKEGSHLDLEALAACKGTLVFYMGVRTLPATVKGLVKGGLPPGTPAALVYMASTPEQKVVSSTLDKIEAESKKAGIKPPALFVVGRVAELRPRLNWFEDLPLFGKRIVITRPREQSSRQRLSLEKLGAHVVDHASISILPPEDYSPLDRAIDNIEEYFFLIFTSHNGVRFFFERLRTLGHDARKLAKNRICVIGPGTGKALERHGLRADLMPGSYTSEELVPAIEQKWSCLNGKKALLPRADIAPDHILKKLVKAGVSAESVIAYRTVPASQDSEELKGMIKAGGIHAATFASSSAARSFVNMLGKGFLSESKGKMAFVSIGPVTTKTLNELGFPPDAQASEHTIEGLTSAVAGL